jgi:hypothetical protein
MFVGQEQHFIGKHQHSWQMVGSPPQLWYHSTIDFNADPSYGNPPLQKKKKKMKKTCARHMVTHPAKKN